MSLLAKKLCEYIVYLFKVISLFMFIYGLIFISFVLF